jgi:hypothetical protein
MRDLPTNRPISLRDVRHAHGVVRLDDIASPVEVARVRLAQVAAAARRLQDAEERLASLERKHRR